MGGKMSDYLFVNPIVAGKKETWKNYVKEMTGARKKEYLASRKKAGLKTERVFLQETPQGDLAVVRWETENPQRIFEHFAKSQDPFDQWFREKILIECHNMDFSHIPPLNTIVLDHQEAGVHEMSHASKG
jgi:hypothetical protein